MPEAFSTITKNLSWFGLMKRISLELFLCNKVLILEQFSRDFLLLVLTLRKLQNSLMMTIWVILLLVQQTLAQLSEPQSIFTYLSWVSINPISKLLLTSSTFKSEVPTESTQRLMIIFMTSQTRGDLVVQKLILYKICIMV
jgi:hypothetical protein